MYRQALLMAGDPVYRAARMEGDPFPIGLVRLGGGAFSLGRKLGSALGRKLLGGKVARAVARFAGRHPVATSIGGSVAVDIATTKLLGGGKGAAARRLLGGGGGRRMRVTNPKALRRAIRRVTGFAKTVKRVKSAIAKAASAAGVRRGGHKKTFRHGAG